MEDLSKIIKGLECCTSGRGAQCCIGCPYIYPPEGAGPEYDGCDQIMRDALAVIKEVDRARAGG